MVHEELSGIGPGDVTGTEVTAEQAHTYLSDFMRRKAFKAAEMEVFGRGAVTISAND